MKLAYPSSKGNLVKCFCFMVCFLKFPALILSLSLSVSFVKVFQVSACVGERTKPFVAGAIAVAVTRGEASGKRLPSSPSVGVR